VVTASRWRPHFRGIVRVAQPADLGRQPARLELAGRGARRPGRPRLHRPAVRLATGLQGPHRRRGRRRGRGPGPVEDRVGHRGEGLPRHVGEGRRELPADALQPAGRAARAAVGPRLDLPPPRAERQPPRPGADGRGVRCGELSSRDHLETTDRPRGHEGLRGAARRYLLLLQDAGSPLESAVRAVRRRLRPAVLPLRRWRRTVVLAGRHVEPEPSPKPDIRVEGPRPAAQRLEV
jgi:hypothetical protein